MEDGDGEAIDLASIEDSLPYDLKQLGAGYRCWKGEAVDVGKATESVW